MEGPFQSTRIAREKSLTASFGTAAPGYPTVPPVVRRKHYSLLYPQLEETSFFVQAVARRPGSLFRTIQIITSGRTGQQDLDQIQMFAVSNRRQEKRGT
ncbi:hypothetical protein CRENBAI_023371 [Crenichthys baileyi]|uniref:Uncharacterized protein n=1 Tax=Crenichthys baileyi TaxID=28760 RepID=A0AAV9S3B8_9TELE